MEIRVTSVDPMDEISIRTQRSEYRFCVTDPVRRRGILTGGILGNLRRDAFFDHVIPQDTHLPDASTLKTGTRVIFFVAAEGAVKRLTTSVIVELACAPVAITSYSTPALQTASVGNSKAPPPF